MKHAARKSRVILAATGVLAALVGWQAARGEFDKLWMVWGDARPDSGRQSQQQDPTAYWSAKRVVADHLALRTTPTPTTAEAIPMPVEPGSRVTGFEIPAEEISQLVRPAAVAATAPAK